MAHTEHLSDYPTCVNIKHAIFNAQVVYCPHDGGLTMSCFLGSDSGDTWSERTWHYGPFDDHRDVASDLASYLKVVFRRRLLDGVLLHQDDYPEPT